MRAMIAVLLLGCDAGEKPAPPPPPPPAGPPVASIATSMGTLTCELYPDKAPITVANFIGLATGKTSWRDPNSGELRRDQPFYDGLIFHRVIAGFMIQGGDPTGTGRSGPGYTFDDEIWDGAHVGPGVIAMANAGTRNGRGTNGSQFFIMEGDRPDLSDKHTVFGKCAELDVVKAIARVKTDSQDRPIEPVTITKVTISGESRIPFPVEAKRYGEYRENR